jgi:biopolymer transport protein ExbB/TolQ
LGTVIGLMVMFHQMDLKGSQVQSADLAVGVWQKLLNTAFGMMIAIPCLIVFYWLDNRVARVTQEMEWIASYLAEWLSQSHKTPDSHSMATSGNGAQENLGPAALPRLGGGPS